MQARLSLTELASKIESNRDSKRDFTVPSPKIEMKQDQDKTVIEMPVNGGTERFGINNFAHGQLAEKLSIPKKYYDRMLTETPDLLSANVNRWLREEPKNNLMRTLDGNVRAFLSDRYRPIDNDVIAEAVLPHLLNAGVEIKSAEITERRMYLQVVTPKISAEVPTRKGEIVQAGLTLSNSEVGAGSVWFANLLYYLACLNGQIGTTDFRKYHIGRRIGNTDGAELSAFTDRTRQLDDKAFMSALNDLTKNALSALTLDKELKMIEDATKREVGATALSDTVTEISKKHGLNENEKEGILSRNIKGGDLTQFGVANAVTNLANSEQEVPNFDRVIELQKIGHEVMSDGDTWGVIEKKVAPKPTATATA